ncbi:MAG TPA: APC family permease [Bryobacteraceae bacterium]|jgi:amino acid transporter|nr:APC family permease [Bryobacteraceae bacterium]
MSFLDLLLGKPLTNAEEGGERIGPAAGIPIFGLDALSSAAYGPEAALTLLIPLGALGIAYIVPISGAIILLLAIVYFSYRQTIDAYPGGGGSYTVARENIGAGAGLLAAAALLIDYVLTAAVGISAGVGALVSAVPSLLPHTLLLCLGILLVITIVNLRGVKEAGGVFMIPTYLFLGTLLITILIGAVKAFLEHGHPTPVLAPPPVLPATAMVGAWLLLKAFSSGCTALTGVEAVSNGVRAFRDPTSENAKKTLSVIIGLLIILLAGIAWLVRAYNIAATDPGAAGYQSVLSMLVAAVTGKGVFYYVTIAAILMVLSLSANTAFADLPRLCRIIALDGYLPRSLSNRGRRLVYSEGIYALAVLTGGLLVLFGGVTDRLIPLYAVGAFLAFTLSQLGMVFHWKRVRGPHAVRNMFINGLGSFVTGITVLVVLVAKFVDGAWITMLLIPGLLLLMYAVHRHYQHVSEQVADSTPIDLTHFRPAMVIVPIERWSAVAKKAITFALSISPDVIGLHVDCEWTAQLKKEWQDFVEKPAQEVGLSAPRLVVLPSPYRYISSPIVQYVLDLQKKDPDRQLAVLIPELVERHWYYYFLHNQRAAVLKTWLYVKGSQKIAVVNVPWYIE